MSCHICCEDFNESNRNKIICGNPDCELEACKHCTRTYLTSVTEPHCMACKISFNQHFLVMNLNRAYVEKDYRKHKQKLLLEREMSKMPETMAAAEKASTINEILEQNNKLTDEICELRKQMLVLERQKNLNFQRINQISNKAQKSKQQFIMSCPDEDCRGYLNSAYKCGLCKLYTCSECLEIIGYNKDTDEHKCNGDLVKTAQLIKDSTRPCPGCGERIYKIEGCDQMWCTLCHVAFSWKSGIIDKGVIHNPHFYQYQQNNEGEVARNPQDMVCGGMPNFWHIQKELKKNFIHPSCDTHKGWLNNLGELHRTFAHIQYQELAHVRNKIREYSDFEEYRIRYILKQITQKELGQTVFRKDNLCKKYTELLHIYELVHATSVDLFRWIYDYVFNTMQNTDANTDTNTDTNTEREAVINTIQTKIDTLEPLRLYINDQLSKISISYNHKVPQFEEKTWKISTTKFSLSSAKTKAKRG